MASSVQIYDIELREDLAGHSASWIHSGSRQRYRHVAYQCCARGCPDRFSYLLSLGIGYVMGLDPGELLPFIFRCPHRRPQFPMIQPDEIVRIYSKPEAFSQCRRWLTERFPKADLVPRSSTSRAVSDASNEPGSAAVGSPFEQVKQRDHARVADTVAREIELT